MKFQPTIYCAPFEGKSVFFSDFAHLIFYLFFSAISSFSVEAVGKKETDGRGRKEKL